LPDEFKQQQLQLRLPQHPESDATAVVGWNDELLEGLAATHETFTLAVRRLMSSRRRQLRLAALSAHSCPLPILAHKGF